jgi:hypothetical protein
VEKYEAAFAAKKFPTLAEIEQSLELPEQKAALASALQGAVAMVRSRVSTAASEGESRLGVLATTRNAEIRCYHFESISEAFNVTKQRFPE